MKVRRRAFTSLLDTRAVGMLQKCKYLREGRRKKSEPERGLSRNTSTQANALSKTERSESQAMSSPLVINLNNLIFARHCSAFFSKHVNADEYSLNNRLINANIMMLRGHLHQRRRIKKYLLKEEQTKSVTGTICVL